MLSPKLTRSLAAGAAAIAVAVGGFAIGNSNSGDNASGTTNAPRAAGPALTPQSDQLTPVSGQIPKGWSPGSGTIITGAAADKVKAAALATKYPGTVNRVLKLSDGSYVAHLLGTSGPHHVFVNQAFKVTGVA
jgi:hypothetical protein